MCIWSVETSFLSWVLKSLPLTSVQWYFICLVHGSAAFVPEKSEVKGCVVIEMRLRGQLSVWRQGGGRGTHYHTALQTSHSISPSGATSISMYFSPSSVSLSSDLFLCPAQLWDSKVVLWFCESREADCYSSRCLCVWSALIAALCFWCSAFALVSTWIHTQALFAAVFLHHVISGFYCCCLTDRNI